MNESCGPREGEGGGRKEPGSDQLMELTMTYSRMLQAERNQMRLQRETLELAQE